MARIGSHRGTVGVIGAGRFGVALAETIARHGFEVLLYTSLEDRARVLTNDRRLPDIVPELDALHDFVSVTTDAATFASKCTLQLLTVSSEYFNRVMDPLGDHLDGAHQIVHAFHTLHGEQLLTVSERTKALSCVLQVGVLAGPMHVSELLAGQPNAAVVGSAFPGITRAIQTILGGGHIQVYQTRDIRGVELAAALGQPVALLVGLVDGLNMGAASHAALLTRGLSEMERLGRELGAEGDTFHGLAGTGRLVDAVRRNEPNYAYGRKLATSRSLRKLVDNAPPEVQGIDVLRNVSAWCAQHGTSIPIVQSLSRILDGSVRPGAGILELMQHSTSGR